MQINGLVDPPQRKGPTCSKARIDAIDEVKAAIVTRADERLLFTERESIERASKFSKHDLDDDEIFVALFINGENFGYDGSHLRQFLCSTKTNNQNQREHPLIKAPGPRTPLRLVPLVGEETTRHCFTRMADPDPPARPFKPLGRSLPSPKWHLASEAQLSFLRVGQLSRYWQRAPGFLPE